MKFNPWFACDQFNSTNHSAFLEPFRQHLVAYFDRMYTQLYFHRHITFMKKMINKEDFYVYSIALLPLDDYCDKHIIATSFTTSVHYDKKLSSFY